MIRLLQFVTAGPGIEGLKSNTYYIPLLAFTASLLSSGLVSCSPLVETVGEVKSPSANKFLLTLALGVMPTAGAEGVVTGLAVLGAATLAAGIWLGTASLVLLLKLNALGDEAAVPEEDPKLNKPPAGGAKLNGALEVDI